MGTYLPRIDVGDMKVFAQLFIQIVNSDSLIDKHYDFQAEEPSSLKFRLNNNYNVGGYTNSNSSSKEDSKI